jgi:ring-1,2-phenylacetyl-CoA epoxidase subunit PaaC
VVGDPLFEYLLRLADDRLILGHRLSEWCGHAPILEEDIAISNIALDLIGQAAALLKLAAEYEGKGRSEDALAYLRDAVDFRNCQLVEQPKGDFAVTIVRQFLFDAFDVLVTARIAALGASAAGVHAQVGGVAAKALKEATYHLRHSAEWVRMLGDGTAESHERAQRALDGLWRFTGELFAADDVDREMVARGIAPDIATLRAPWLETVSAVVRDATLTLPNGGEPGAFQASGGRMGRHSEHLGLLLAEMQIVARSHPGASW